MSEIVTGEPTRWKSIKLALAEFRSYLSPRIPEFPIITACDSCWDDADYKRLRPKGFPTRMRGVYMLFEEDDELLYVGLALVNFDKRVWSHDKMLAEWEKERRWTDVILLEPEYVFLAPSLEYFLICRLTPRCNSTYKYYEIPSVANKSGPNIVLP